MAAVSGSADVWGLVADVHGNYPALQQALRVLREAGARRVAFLGDYLGRGDNDRTVRLIRQVADLAVVGNRDLDWQERVSPDIKAWIQSLPKTAASGQLLLTHGDARLTPALSTSQINRDFLRTWQAMERAEASVWAFGHSHQARIWRKLSASAPADQLTADTVAMDAPYRYCLNVGTTGLPFPGKGGQYVALVDLDTRHIRQLPLRVDRIGPE